MHAAGVKKGKNPAQKTVIHKKDQHDFLQFFRMYPRKHQTDVHGNTAKLEREMPPVVVALSKEEGQAPLFPDFADSHDKTAGKEEYFVSIHRHHLFTHRFIPLYFN